MTFQPGGANGKGESSRSTTTMTTTTSTTTTTTRVTTPTTTTTSSRPKAIYGKIIRPSPPAEMTARPRFTLFVKDRWEKPTKPSKIPRSDAEVKAKVTKVSQLKEALGYGAEDKRELWQLLGRRRRDAAEGRRGRGH